MKANVMMAVMSGVLLSVAMSTPVLADTLKPAKMTCEEFVALDSVARPKVVYWAEGFNKKGKPVDSVVDIAETDRVIPAIVEECKATPKQTLWQKIKKNF